MSRASFRIFRLLLALPLLALPLIGNAAITVADNNLASAASTGADSATSVGDLICVGTQGTGSGTISDTLDPPYTSFGTVTTGYGDVLHMACVVVTVAGTPTFSSTGSVSRINFIRYSGFTLGATIIPGDFAGTVGVSTSLASTPFNASHNSEICWGIFDNGNTPGTVSGQFNTAGLYTGNLLGQASTLLNGLISAGTSVTLTIGYGTAADWGVMVQCFYDTTSTSSSGGTYLINQMPVSQWQTVTGNTTLSAQNPSVLCNAAGGAVTINAPSAVHSLTTYSVLKIDTSANACTLTPQSGQTLAGQSTYPLNGYLSGITLVSDNANWWPPGYFTNPAIAPTISSGFGTSPVVGAGAKPSSFYISVGTGGTVSTGTVTLPTNPHGWACHAADTTTPAGNMTQQTGSSATSASFTNYSRTTGSATAWPAADNLELGCAPN